MKSDYHIVGLLALLMFLYAPSGATQDAETDDTEAGAEESVDAPAGQEVEVNEDNYRQFMELKDARQQRMVFPETAYKSQAGMQKLDKLPEESQKHLRNQLREIIVQGDPWKPGDEDTEYPYTPSDAASNNPPLQKQEAEAWGELVDNYHKREAEIYANAARSEAAAAPGSQAGGGAGDGEGAARAGDKQGSAGQQASQDSRSGQNGTAGSYSPNSANGQSIKSTAGVSQNAMEFLKSQSGTSSSAAPTDQNTAAPGGDKQQEVAQENAQNALEYLMTSSEVGSSSEPAQLKSETPKNSQKTEVTQEDAQNALEYLTGDIATPADSNHDEDTISIEELLNVQGVSGAIQVPLPAADDSNQPGPGEIPADKDGEGR